ncbi:MAG: hypothetical protein GXO79_00240 [Chlorobi bacterium]|nr:hypothetical protein [Chlorobiota bacterium]
MAKKNSDQLFQLIKSLTKSEKRYFKLYISRITSAEDAKFYKLFDIVDRQKEYNEQKILIKAPSIKSNQLSNIKAHLYKQILQSLRLYYAGNNIDFRIRELLDYTTILYNRCLYDLSFKSLEKARNLAVENDRASMLYQIIEFEKILVTRFIKSNIEDQVNQIIGQSDIISKKLASVNTFANLMLKLYSFYLKIGFIRNHKDFELANSFLYSTLPVFNEEQLSFDEKMYLYNALVGYYFFIQDFVRGYDYAKKWIELFDNNKKYVALKPEMYIKALNNFLVAQAKLGKYKEFNETAKRFDELKELPENILTLNIQLLIFKYSSTHKINRFFMLGLFTDGVKEIPKIELQLEQFSNKLATNYILIFYYKFACMYFGASDFQKAVFWCNKVLNTKEVNLRSDIYSFARILTLISHYELGNIDLIDYYIRSTYRYLIKKENLSKFYKITMKFLKKLGGISPSELIDAFKTLKEQLLPLTNNPYEKISFIYFDIISWLECKIENVPVQDVIREKAAKRLKIS